MSDSITPKQQTEEFKPHSGKVVPKPPMAPLINIVKNIVKPVTPKPEK
jgi:hypothetical protein